MLPLPESRKARATCRGSWRRGCRGFVRREVAPHCRRRRARAAAERSRQQHARVRVFSRRPRLRQRVNERVLLRRRFRAESGADTHDALDAWGASIGRGGEGVEQLAPQLGDARAVRSTSRALPFRAEPALCRSQRTTAARSRISCSIAPSTARRRRRGGGLRRTDRVATSRGGPPRPPPPPPPRPPPPRPPPPGCRRLGRCRLAAAASAAATSAAAASAAACASPAADASTPSASSSSEGGARLMSRCCRTRGETTAELSIGCHNSAPRAGTVRTSTSSAVCAGPARRRKGRPSGGRPRPLSVVNDERNPAATAPHRPAADPAQQFLGRARTLPCRGHSRRR